MSLHNRHITVGSGLFLSCPYPCQRQLPPCGCRASISGYVGTSQQLVHALPSVTGLPPWDCRASISGYEDASRAVIKRTLELLGGTTTDSMTRRNTHLLVPDPSGSKYLHCGLFGVCPVTADWLLDCIANGQLMPEEHYHPAAFVQQPGVGGAEGGGAVEAGAAAGGSGVVHSNLPSEEGATRGSGGQQGVVS